MLQRGIGITIGAFVSLILLLITSADAMEDYLMPLVVGGVGAFFWPVVIAFWLGRRAKQRREDEIQSEVQRQLDQGKKT